MRERMEIARKAHQELRAASLAASFDGARVRELADTAAKALADTAVLRAEATSKVVALLTPEQRAKLEERRQRVATLEEKRANAQSSQASIQSRKGQLSEEIARLTAERPEPAASLAQQKTVVSEIEQSLAFTGLAGDHRQRQAAATMQKAKLSAPPPASCWFSESSPACHTWRFLGWGAWPPGLLIDYHKRRRRLPSLLPFLRRHKLKARLRNSFHSI